MRLLFLLMLSALTMGCSTSPEPTSVSYALNISADASSNPSEKSSANPILVRIYQLTDQQSFKQIPFIDLYNNDAELLANNLISKEILPIILPDSQVDKMISIDKKTQFIAVIAEFTQFKNSQTKSITSVPNDEEQYLSLDINKNTIDIAVITPKSPWWHIF
ncbi:type VI secretion system lipoprotein TssJ [Vibrio sp.]|nr:type VI secretion system lipoprotein TssJ [Vibrio sp.]